MNIIPVLFSDVELAFLQSAMSALMVHRKMTTHQMLLHGQICMKLKAYYDLSQIQIPLDWNKQILDFPVKRDEKTEDL